jgi:hypothetical protein
MRAPREDSVHRRPFWFLFVLALAAGAFTMWVSTLPEWDGSGITCMLIITATSVLAFIRPEGALAFAIAVSAWVVALGLLRGHPTALFAFVVGIGGSYLGAVSRRLMAHIVP